MNWDAIAAVGELLGAGGVMASLLYLARELRRTSAADRRAAAREAFARLKEIQAPISTNAGVASIWVRGSASLSQLVSQEEAIQFGVLMLRYFKGFEELTRSRRDGWLEDWAWESCRLEFSQVIQAPGVVEWWARRRHWFRSEFQKDVEELMSEDAHSLLSRVDEQLGGAVPRAGQILGPHFGSADDH